MEEDDSEPFERLKVGMYVEAMYPDGELVKARVLAIQPHNGGHVTVHFEGNRLSRQRTFPRSSVNDPRQFKIPDADDLKQVNKSMHFINALKAINLNVVGMSKEGGHSMFRALSYQLFGTETNWKAVRHMCLQHMIKHKEYFQHFVDCEFEQYIAAKRKAETMEDYYAPGDHLDLQAICEIYDVGVKIYSDMASRPFEYIGFYADQHADFQKKMKYGCILLFYRGDDEYDSLVEDSMPVPLKRSIGFQDDERDLGGLSERDIKGDILKARQREFQIWKERIFGQKAMKMEASLVSTYEGEWDFDPKKPQAKTVFALIKQFDLSEQTSSSERLDMISTAESSTVKIEITRVDTKKGDQKHRTLRRKFKIHGLHKDAIELVNFCTKYFPDLKLSQTKSASIGNLRM
uniref:OTU domain-containing protein n=1 Tax=Lotharella oceanica TaxID=641309 RepID=A0A7S2XEQ3_9EUKA